jgi:nucleotide-binding universal stress UspA family protein
MTSRASSRRPRRPTRPAILAPVDGSRASRRAVREAAALAARLGARVVGLHVITLFGPLPQKGLPAAPTAAAFARHASRVASKWLSAVKRAAVRAGVPYRCDVTRARSPAAGIVAAARAHRCRYIVMGSHGRRGLARVLLGSVTRAVLARSPIPVLVCRPAG